MPVRIARTLALTAGVIVAFYFYQPQRYDFFPRPAPEPNPPVDPDSAKLFAKGTRVAVVAAHPDDPEFFIGGTLLKLHNAGAKLAIVMCTDGDKGYYPWFMTDATKNRVTRRAEQIEAASHYGAEVYFLGRPDGRLWADDALVSAVRQALTDFQPDYVLTFDPDYPPRIQHSDHLESGIAGIKAARQVPSVRWILRFSTHAPNYVVDVTKYWDEREKLLAIHKSQFYGSRLEMVREMIQERSEAEGEAKGFEEAEAFRCSRGYGSG